MKQPGFPGGVTVPVLLLHHYANEEIKDTVISTDAIVSTFELMNGGQPHEKSRRVPISDGNHVLTSAYVRADHDAVLSAVRAFLTHVLGPPKT